MSLFISFEILGLFVLTITTDDKYSRHCWETNKFAQPIQMHLSKKPKFVLEVSSRFWNLDNFLNILKKKMSLTA